MTMLLKPAPNLSTRIFAAKGWALMSAVPFPHSPTSFRPHFQTVPLAASAEEWLSPPETTTMLLTFNTWTAFDRLMAVPSPTSPLVLFPQAQTVPSACNRWEERRVGKRV